MEDRELIDHVRRAAAGDREATETLVRTYMEHMRKHVSRRVGARLRRRLETDDILQSSLALAVRDLEGKQLEFDGERPFLAWLLKVAERKIQMAARRHGAGKRDLERELPLDGHDRAAEEGPTPSRAAVANERAAQVQQALAHLDPEDRQIMEMRLFEGLTFGEMAARLDAGTEDAMRQRYVRLVARVGPQLKSALGLGGEG